MQDDPKPLARTTLSPTEAKRVLERAAQIDAGSQSLSVSDLASAAREAGIPEQAVLQAVQELLDGQQSMTAADRNSIPSNEDVRRHRPWLIGIGSGLSLLLVLMIVFFILRTIP